MNKLVGPDGMEIPKTLTVEYNDKRYPYRIINQDVLSTRDPMIATMASLVQQGDQLNIVLLGMMCLAKDIYKPGGQEFYKFAKQLNLNIIDIERNELDIALELSKIL